MEINRKAKPSYKTTDSLAQFPADMTVFRRLDHDPEFAGRIRRGEQVKNGNPGAHALSTAAFALAGILSRSAYGPRQSPHPTAKARNTDSEALSIQVKEAAQLFGAALVGITVATPYWLYTKLEDSTTTALRELKTAVVIAVSMDREMIAKSPGPEASAATGNGYAKMAYAVGGVAGLIRTLGYTALGCGNDTALSIPLAVDAGLGEMGRNGILTTRKYGSCIRLCKVFTDMPLVPDKPVSFGMKDLCESCRACVSACPVDAISDGEQTDTAINSSCNSGVLKWPVDGEKCRRFWHTNGTSCSNCIDACPLTPR